MPGIQPLLATLVFFTRVPCGRWYRHDAAHEARACVFLPVVGWLAGALGGGVYLLMAIVLPTDVAVVLAMMSTALATGAMHEDGLADFCDALGAGGDRERMLAVMSDPRCGAFGALGLMLVLLLKFASLAALLPAARDPVLVMALWLSAHATSRLAAASFVAVLDHAKANGTRKTRDVAKRMVLRDLLLCAGLGLAPLALFAAAGEAYLSLAALAGFAAATVTGVVFVPRLGGYTGDCLGAVQQLSETAFFVAALALTLRGA